MKLDEKKAIGLKVPEIRKHGYYYDRKFLLHYETFAFRENYIETENTKCLV